MRAPSYLLLLAASASLALTAAFPSGAPDSACKDMRPGHGVEPATSAAPFELTQDKQQAEAGDQIKGKWVRRKWAPGRPEPS